jgi:hypothetical protein
MDGNDRDDSFAAISSRLTIYLEIIIPQIIPSLPPSPKQRIALNSRVPSSANASVVCANNAHRDENTFAELAESQRRVRRRYSDLYIRDFPRPFPSLDPFSRNPAVTREAGRRKAREKGNRIVGEIGSDAWSEWKRFQRSLSLSRQRVDSSLRKTLIAPRPFGDQGACSPSPSAGGPFQSRDKGLLRYRLGEPQRGKDRLLVGRPLKHRGHVLRGT